MTSSLGKAERSSQRQAGRCFTEQFKVDAGPVKKALLEETDKRRLQVRQKQVDFGKNTLGYQCYLEQIPKHMRHCTPGPLKVNPATPDIRQICSKRSFDGQIRKWRRDLHYWDPTGEEGGEDPDEPVLLSEALNQPPAAAHLRPPLPQGLKRQKRDEEEELGSSFEHSHLPSPLKRARHQQAEQRSGTLPAAEPCQDEEQQQEDIFGDAHEFDDV